MSDYFFYDINKKMADLAKKQQLTEDAQATPANPAPSALRTQLNERDLGKHNNATTGFAALAKKTGGGEKGAKIAGAQLAKMRAKGQVEEGSKPDFLDLDKDGNRKEPMKSAARGAKKDIDESAFQAAIGKKKYGDQGMKALQKAGRNHAGAATMNKIRNQYDKYDESMGMADEGNAFSGAVVKAKRDGVQPGEKIRVGGKQYPVREASAPVYGPGDMEGATAPPAKGKDGQYPIVTAGPHKGKRWSPTTPGPTNPTMKEAAKYRDPKYKDKLYTQNPPEDDADTSLDTYYDRVKPAGYQGAKRLKGGDEYSRTDPLTRGFGRSGTGSPVEKGPRKGLPKRDQIRSLKGSIKDAHGTHAQPNLPEGEGGIPQTPKQKSFAKLAPPVDKITFADRIVGAKKEVDEMLGDVAANAMKKAVGQIDWTDDDRGRRRSSSGGRVDTTTPGVTRHSAGQRYSGAGHDEGGDDEPTGAVGRRKVGAGQGKKIGAKINRGTSKLMTREGDMPEDMFEPQDSGEYDREGEMAKDDIKTVVRHAQALEKILGDNDNLPEWVQAKLAKIEGMMTAVDDYMQNQKSGQMGSSEMDEEQTSKRDNRAERAGKRVAKDIEYDEKKKDGIHGKRRDSEDDKAEKAGKKVAKDIEYDEKKDKKKDDKKEVDETTTSGSVATGGSAPKSGGGHNYGKGIYDSLNRKLENMISESMNINMSMNNDDHGGPRKSLTVTATDEDAVMLAGLLKMAGLGHGDDQIHDMTDNNPQMLAIHDMDQEEPCPACGSSSCGCEQSMDEAYGDTDATQNEPDYPTDQVGTDDAMMYSGGLDGPKSTGQTTIPVIAGQDDRTGYNGDHELRRMMEIAGLR